MKRKTRHSPFQAIPHSRETGSSSLLNPAIENRKVLSPGTALLCLLCLLCSADLDLPGTGARPLGKLISGSSKSLPGKQADLSYPYREAPTDKVFQETGPNFHFSCCSENGMLWLTKECPHTDVRPVAQILPRPNWKSPADDSEIRNSDVWA